MTSQTESDLHQTLKKLLEKFFNEHALHYVKKGTSTEKWITYGQNSDFPSQLMASLVEIPSRNEIAILEVDRPDGTSRYLKARNVFTELYSTIRKTLPDDVRVTKYKAEIVSGFLVASGGRKIK